MHVSTSLHAHLKYEIVSATEQGYRLDPGGGPNPLTATVNAPEGMRVVGGGFQLHEPEEVDGWSIADDFVIEKNAPSTTGDAWEVTVRSTSDAPGDVTVWAVCVAVC